MCGRLTSMSTSAPTPGIRCVPTRHLASGATSNITMVMVYLHYQHPGTAHNKLTISCREWDSLYNTHAQIRILIDLRYRPRTVKQLDRIQPEATVATNLPASVTECTHNDNIRDYAVRNRRINWAAENSVATSPQRQTSRTRQTLLRARKAALVLS